jgi:hypothetical protein
VSGTFYVFYKMKQKSFIENVRNNNDGTTQVENIVLPEGNLYVIAVTVYSPT